MSKKIWIPIAIVCFIAAVAGFVIIKRQTGYQKVKVEMGDIVEAIYALGEVKTRRQFDLKIGVLAEVQKVHVREGDLVRKGDPLVKFRESLIFSAPFDGVVSQVTIDEGESAVPNTTLVRVDDPYALYIEVSLEQQGALRVQRGQKAEIVFESLRGEKLTGEVSAVFARNKDFLARIDVPNFPSHILPGMTPDVAIVIGRHENVKLIPVSAIRNGNVLRERNGQRQRIPLKIGSVDGLKAEIAEGDLAVGDLVLLKEKN